MFKSFLSLLLSVLFFASSVLFPSIVSGLTKEQKSLYRQDILYYDLVCDSTINSSTEDSASLEGREVNLESVAEEFNLHSASVKELGGEVVNAYKANQQPNTSPGSLKKLLIADAFLNTNPNLNKTVTVTDEHVYGGGSPRGTIWDPEAGDDTTLRQSLKTMLSNSSNSQANVLITESGGRESVNQKVSELGYNNSSNIGSLFKFNGDGGPSSRSTVSDITKAMEKIFKTGGPKYAVAQEGLRSSTYTFGLDSEANKWGGHGDFTGNSGIFKVNGKEYIITLFLEEPWDDDRPEYNYTAPATPSVGKIKQATEKIIQQLGGQPEEQQSGGCACAGGGGVSVSGSISSEVGKGMSSQEEFQSLVVAAAEKYDMDPNYLAAFYFIENNGHVKSLDEGSWREPAPPYGNGPPWPTSYAGAKGPWQFIDSTWDAYGADGNNDGNKDVNDLKDATFGAANYLSALGGKKNASDQKLRDAAFGYNHSSDYVDSIMKIYQELSGGPSSDVSSTGGCASGGGSSGNFIWPVAEEYPITSCWNTYRSYYNGGAGGGHSGMDIGAPSGAEIVASDGGKVATAENGDLGGFGKAVVIDHENGFFTLYAHMKVVSVSAGDQVPQGQKIGEVNNTGSSRGDHLHFNIQKQPGPQGTSATTLNPLDHLPEDGRSNPGCKPGPVGGPSGYEG